MNFNVPNLPLEKIKGITVTRAASRAYIKLSGKQNRSNISYSADTHRTSELELEKETDVWAIVNGFISITPIRIEVTEHDSKPTLNKWTAKIEEELKRVNV